MTGHFKDKVKDFKKPTQLPPDDKTAQKWQTLNKAWWENNPMRYDWREGINAEPGTTPYFEEIDRRFFESVRHYMPWRNRPFDNLINFADLRDKAVLEIGVGQGTHAQLIAPYCKSFTGIDLTEIASRMTAKRLALAGIQSDIFCMDAEDMAFPDHTFDFIWSWGVIHHSANTLKVLKEMRRVMKPGGTSIVMIYHRSFWKYYIECGFIRGILLGGLWREQGLHGINQVATDGAIARYYHPRELQQLCEGLFEIKQFYIIGQKSDVIPLPAGLFKKYCEKMLPDSFTRFLTNRLGMGSFLTVKMNRI